MKKISFQTPKFPNSINNRLTWIVISIIFLALAFWFTFVEGSIAQGIVWLGAAIAFFIIANNPKN